MNTPNRRNASLRRWIVVAANERLCWYWPNASINFSSVMPHNGIAEILKLSRRSSVAVYRARYEDFPTPVVDMGAGRCLLWLRSDIERWAKARRS